jgi:hypothetical protein
MAIEISSFSSFQGEKFAESRRHKSAGSVDAAMDLLLTLQSFTLLWNAYWLASIQNRSHPAHSA